MRGKLGQEHVNWVGRTRSRRDVRREDREAVTVIVCVLLAVGAIGFTLLVREKDIPPAPVENPELKHLEARRQVLLENLKDLQFEYHQGKLSGDDYQSLKGGFLYDLAAVMDSIERLQGGRGGEAKAAAEPGSKAKLKPKPSAAAVAEVKCPSCATANPLSNRFCGHCGAGLS